jgi:hypothetical protein
MAAYDSVPSVFGEDIPTAEFWKISSETACWDIEKKIAKFFNEDFYLPLYLPLCLVLTISLLKKFEDGFLFRRNSLPSKEFANCRECSSS